MNKVISNKEFIYTTKYDPSIDCTWLNKVIAHNLPSVVRTRNPSILYNWLKSFRYSNCIIYCCVSNWGRTRLEKNVYGSSETVRYINKLCSLIGSEKVILYLNPVVPVKESWIEINHLIFKHLKHKIRLKVSFFEMNDYIKHMFLSENFELPYNGKDKPDKLKKLAYIKKLQEIYSHNNIETCCKEKLKYDTPCISTYECNILSIPIKKRSKNATCNCLGNKKIIESPLYHCTYDCLHCSHLRG